MNTWKKWGHGVNTEHRNGTGRHRGLADGDEGYTTTGSRGRAAKPWRRTILQDYITAIGGNLSSTFLQLNKPIYMLKMRMAAKSSLVAEGQNQGWDELAVAIEGFGLQGARFSRSSMWVTGVR
jgi:hypothetical protein